MKLILKYQEGEDIDKVLKMYRQKIESSDLIKEVKKHQEYIKPSQKQRNNFIKARYKQFLKYSID
ncbi:30S ribosomal protein S21 [Candidatus Karelsulcia muelleri]|uniref:30S ribosomal protein S21 n=1 Tax=Candidatus Karelsulcia muelleri TaxID=336810 RepID=UPI0023636BEC|nr:30S ribosomal protein S21 [Candidatus Karelsulcia muelleri]WDE42219.1 30S ribosomal protein S21 [Candidatus Karelsulcia muelleri]WDR79066.1 30S ribosomal protein S21 [Candidatus Karelsulcia muelleri]